MEEFELIKSLVHEDHSLGRISEQTATEILRIADKGIEKLIKQ